MRKLISKKDKKVVVVEFVDDSYLLQFNDIAFEIKTINEREKNACFSKRPISIFEKHINKLL